jgi:hypothetical protein
MNIEWDREKKIARSLARALGAFRDAAGLIRLDLRGLLVFPLNRVVDFASVDRYLARSVDAEPHAVSANVDDRHDHIVANHDAFVALSGENQHVVTRSAQKLREARRPGNLRRAETARAQGCPAVK